MSYIALARKWRPGTFSEVVGQEHVLTALENALQQNRLHHAYLLSGTRGVGKTTIGRLFAKGLNCETGITHTPCGVCSSCREIDDGRFVDLLEIDAASRTKVEDTRELLDNVQYKPARGRFKVYLIDEVHMLSRHSFNALLKTLEEPPEYVKFILATTDPQKLPVTILSRCLQFHLKPIESDAIHTQLSKILSHESIAFENKALGLLSHAADGSMRDALSLTDQGIALGNGQIQVDLIAQMLGTLDTDHAIHILESIAQKQAQTIFNHVELLAKHGVDWNALLKEISNQLHRIALYQALPSTIDDNAPDIERVALLSQQLAPEEIQLYYQIALKGREEMAFAPSAKSGLEMTLLRMLAFRPAKASVLTTFDSEAAQTSPNIETPVPTVPNVVPVVSTRPTTMDRMEPLPVESMPVESLPIEPKLVKPSQPATHHSVQPDFVEPPQPPVQSAPIVQAPAEKPKPAASPLTAMRHQLRSQRQQLTGNEGGESSVKKSKPAARKSSSVFERVASKPATDSQSQLKSSIVSQSQANSALVTPESDKSDSYQWKAKNSEQTVVDKGLTPTQLKQALEHTKTPEMITQLQKEAADRDAWSKLIQQLKVAKLVEQLALNSHFEQEKNHISLTLRESQQHLINDRAVQELQSGLSELLSEACSLTVTVGDTGQTPLEIRDAIYQDKLQQSMNSLAQDSNIQFMQARFAAELDDESVRPI
jgi:DNA polymerase-3 subunit gamma/tau